MQLWIVNPAGLEVVALENPVLLDHPVILRRDEGLQNGGGHVRVVAAAQRVADVVQQRAHHVFFVALVAQRQGGCLQGVRVAIDRRTAKVPTQQFQRGVGCLAVDREPRRTGERRLERRP